MGQQSNHNGRKFVVLELGLSPSFLPVFTSLPPFRNQKTDSLQGRLGMLAPIVYILGQPKWPNDNLRLFLTVVPLPASDYPKFINSGKERKSERSCVSYATSIRNHLTRGSG